MRNGEKVLLIVGAGGMQVPLIEKAHEMQFFTLALDGSEKAIGAKIAHDFLVADISKPEECLKILQKQRPNIQIDGVVTVGTDFSNTVAFLAQELSLPGIPLSVAWKAKNKILMRQEFQKAGVNSPLFLAVEPGDPLPTWPYSYPMVVKPSDNMGARGVLLIAKPEDLLQGMIQARQNSPTGSILLEEYIPGPEFSVDAIVRGEDIYIEGLADRHIFYPPSFIEMGHTFPCLKPQAIQEAVIAQFKKGVKALGINWGAAKGDIKWDGHKAVVGEIAARLSGGYMSGWTYPLSSGRSSIQWAIETALGLPLTEQSTQEPGVVLERAIISIPGRLNSIVTFEDPIQIHGLKHLFCQIQPGDLLKFPTSNVEKVGNFIIQSPSIHRGEELASRVRKALFIRLEPHEALTKEFLVGEDSRSLLFTSSPEKPLIDSYGWSVADHWDLAQKVLEKSLVWSESVSKVLEKGGAQGLVWWFDSHGQLP